MKKTNAGHDVRIQNISMVWTLLLASTLSMTSSAQESPRAADVGGPGSTVILAGTDAGIHRIEAPSDPARAAIDPWLEREAALHGGPRSVRCIAREPATGALLAGFGLRGSGLVRSDDGGLTWTPVAGWTPEREAWSAAFADGGVWVGGQPADLWVGSLAGEAPWTRNESLRAVPERAQWDFIRPPFEAHLLDLRRDPHRPEHWLGAIEQGGVIESEDCGVTWRQASPIWDAHRVAFASDGAAIAATGAGIFVRADGSEEWSATAAPDGYATGLAVDSAGALFAAVRDDDRGALWTSVDAGRTWIVANTEPALPEPDFGVHALEADPSRAGVLYHGAGGEIWRVEGGRAVRIAQDLPTLRRLLVFAERRAE